MQEYVSDDSVASGINIGTTSYPTAIQRFNIYDVFHNDQNQLVVITPDENDKPLDIIFNNLSFYVHVCPHGHTHIYVLNDVAYQNEIDLQINGVQIKTRVNKYADLGNTIIFSTIVLNEDKYIRQWIQFHKNIGIDHFVIYDNSPGNSLESILSDFVKSKLVTLIKWDYPYMLERSGISGQTTQQNHSIYAFQTSRLIGLFDVDEYINVQKESSIYNLISNYVRNHNVNVHDVGSFQLSNKFFYNPQNLPTDGFEFLKIFECAASVTPGRHQKQFVIPQNVSTFSVHIVTRGKSTIIIDPEECFFNHYYFLNKAQRGRDRTGNYDSSIQRHTASFNS